jgi:hypothetical protein
MMSGEPTVVDPAPLGASGSDFSQENRSLRVEPKAPHPPLRSRRRMIARGRNAFYMPCFGVGAEAAVPPPVMDLITAIIDLLFNRT